MDYETCWTDLTEVTNVRKGLGAAPCRKHLDNTDFYTLPIVFDHNSNRVVGDSFEIALYLDEVYPSSPQLFPDSAVASLRDFNAHVNEVFTAYVVLGAHTIPFNPQTAEKARAEFCRRAGRQNWDDFAVCGPERATMLKGFEKALGELAESYAEQGSALALAQGSTPTYADFIVGGWLWMLKETLPEWDLIRTWQDGLWGRIHETLSRTYGQAD